MSLFSYPEEFEDSDNRFIKEYKNVCNEFIDVISMYKTLGSCDVMRIACDLNLKKKKNSGRLYNLLKTCKVYKTLHLYNEGLYKYARGNDIMNTINKIFAVFYFIKTICIDYDSSRYGHKFIDSNYSLINNLQTFKIIFSGTMFRFHAVIINNLTHKTFQIYIRFDYSKKCNTTIVRFCFFSNNVLLLFCNNVNNNKISTLPNSITCLCCNDIDKIQIPYKTKYLFCHNLSYKKNYNNIKIMNVRHISHKIKLCDFNYNEYIKTYGDKIIVTFLHKTCGFDSLLHVDN
jgi:hypothetical protein